MMMSLVLGLGSTLLAMLAIVVCGTLLSNAELTSQKLISILARTFAVAIWLGIRRSANSWQGLSIVFVYRKLSLCCLTSLWMI